MSTTPEEQLQTLPVNHPEAGYVAPAKDTIVATGTVPEAEQTAYDDRIAAQEAEEQAVAEHEHEVATSEPTPSEDEPDAKAPSSKATSSTSSTKSSGDS